MSGLMNWLRDLNKLSVEEGREEENPKSVKLYCAGQRITS